MQGERGRDREREREIKYVPRSAPITLVLSLERSFCMTNLAFGYTGCPSDINPAHETSMFMREQCMWCVYACVHMCVCVCVRVCVCVCV